MRAFDGGATRDNIEGKLQFSRFLSYRVLERYCRFMESHRVQTDGNLREPDNWKRGMPTEVYRDSLVRHTFQAWGVTEGENVRDEHGNPIDLEEALCAIIFNASGYLFEVLRASLDSSPTSSSGTPLP